MLAFMYVTACEIVGTVVHATEGDLFGTAHYNAFARIVGRNLRAGGIKMSHHHSPAVGIESRGPIHECAHEVADAFGIAFAADDVATQIRHGEHHSFGAVSPVDRYYQVVVVDSAVWCPVGVGAP